MGGLLALMGIGGMAFVVALSGAMMPGPLLTVTIREAARRGALAGPLIVLGHAILEAALVVAIILGLGRWLHRPGVIGAISLAGGVTLCVMGIGMIRSAGSLTEDGSEDARDGLHPVVAGVLVSLANPYWTIWWATIGLGYLVAGLRYGWPGLAFFFAGHIAADLLWYSAVSFGVARGRRMMGGRVYRGTIRTCGGAMALFGLWFFRAAYQVWQ